MVALGVAGRHGGLPPPTRDGAAPNKKAPIPKGTGASRGTTLVPRSALGALGLSFKSEWSLRRRTSPFNGGRDRRSLLGRPPFGPRLRSDLRQEVRICLHRTRLAERPLPGYSSPSAFALYCWLSYDLRSLPSPAGLSPRFCVYVFRSLRLVRRIQGRLDAEIDIALQRLRYGTAVPGAFGRLAEAGGVEAMDVASHR